MGEAMEMHRTMLCPWKPLGIDALCFAPTSSCLNGTLAVGRENGAMELWDSQTWHLRCASPGLYGRSIVSIVWIDSGSQETLPRLLSAGLHREVTEWDPRTLEPIETATSGGGPIWSLAASKDGATLYASCDDGTIRILSLEGGMGSLMYKGSIAVEKARLLSLAMGSDPDVIFAGGTFSRISKWSVSSRACTGSMMVERAGSSKGNFTTHTLIWSLVNLEDEMLASGDSLGLVYIWDVVACVVLQRFAQHQGDVTALCSNGELLLSGGIDAKITHYARLRGAREERWVHSDATFCHSHDIRAIAIKPSPTQADKHKATYVSGGVAGNLFVQAIGKKGPKKRPMECSAFSPLMHKVWFAEGDCFMLTQQARRLQLWYHKEPEMRLLEQELGEPEIQKVITFIMTRKVKSKDGDKETTHHLTSSALAPDGKMVAASEMTGTRLFNVSAEQLQVRRVKGLPTEVANAPMRAMRFARGLLIMATWHDHRILLLDCKEKTIIQTFEEHQAPVTLLTPGGPDHGEWLLSSDIAGGVNCYDLDALQLHCSIPVGEEMVTALDFDSKCRAVIITSSHHLHVFDIETQSLQYQVTIPPRYLPPHARVCGIASFPTKPNKLLLWGHGFLLGVTLNASGEEAPWQTWNERFILGLASLAGPWKKTCIKGKRETPLIVAVQASEEQTSKLLPDPFERKRFGIKRKAQSLEAKQQTKAPGNVRRAG